jgi:Phosphoenolpyruvate phosphomutase
LRTSGGFLPLLVDADHGYSNARSLNVMRTVAVLESAAVAALTIEDTVLPRPYGPGGRGLTLIEEGVGRIRAALAARAASRFQLSTIKPCLGLAQSVLPGSVASLSYFDQVQAVAAAVPAQMVVMMRNVCGTPTVSANVPANGAPTRPLPRMPILYIAITRPRTSSRALTCRVLATVTLKKPLETPSKNMPTSAKYTPNNKISQI